MKFVIKTAPHPSSGPISLEVDDKPLGYFVAALDLRLRADGVKLVIDTIDVSTGVVVHATRTFYATGESVIEVEMEEADEKSTIAED